MLPVFDLILYFLHEIPEDRRDVVDDSDAPPSPTTVENAVAIFVLISEILNLKCEQSSGVGSFLALILDIIFVFYDLEHIKIDWVWIAFPWMPLLLNDIVPHWTL